MKLNGSSRKRDFSVNAQIEASALLQELVGPVAPGAGAVKSAIRRASTLTGLSYGRTRSIWYGAARVWSEEMDLLREKAARTRKLREAGREAKNNAARAIAADVAEQLAQIQREIETLSIRMARAEADRQGSNTGVGKQGFDA